MKLIILSIVLSSLFLSAAIASSLGTTLNITSSNVIDQGQSVSFIANTLNAPAPYTYNFTISQGSSIIISQVYSGIPANTYSFSWTPQPNKYSTNSRLRANVTITADFNGVGNVMNSTYTYFIYNTSPRISISPQNSSIKLGQSQSWSFSIINGTPPFTIIWHISNGTSWGYSSSNNTINLKPLITGEYTIAISAEDALSEIATNTTTLNVTIPTSGGLVRQAIGIFRPLITPIKNGYDIENLSPYGSFNVILCNKNLQIYDNFVTPTSVGITVDNVSYTLNASQTVTLSNVGSGCYAKFLNVTFLPSLRLANISLTMIPTTSTTSTTTEPTTTIIQITTKSTSTYSTIPSNIVTKTIIPMNSVNTISGNTITSPTSVKAESMLGVLQQSDILVGGLALIIVAVILIKYY